MFTKELWTSTPAQKTNILGALDNSCGILIIIIFSLFFMLNSELSMIKRKFSLSLIGLLVISSFSLKALAQDELTEATSESFEAVATALEGKGATLLNEAEVLVQGGESIETAISSVVDNALTESNDLLNEDQKLLVSENADIAKALLLAVYNQQDVLAAITDVTGSYQNRIREVVATAVALFPNNANDIVIAASLTGLLTEEELIEIALENGATEEQLGTATAAGGDVGPNVTPLGEGVGAAGNGGGDPSASTN